MSRTTDTVTSRQPKLIAVGLYIAVFAATGSAVPYIAVYFEQLGLALDAIGIYFAISALCGLIAAPIWGVVADQVLGSRLSLFVATLAAAVIAGVVGATDVLFVAVLFAVLYQLAASGIDPVLDAFTLDLVGTDRARYARYRVWGSAAFVVAAVVVGVLIQSSSLRVMFLPFVGSLVVAALLALAIPRRTSNRAARPLGGIGEVVRVRPIATFLITSLVVWSANAMINAFFSIHLVALDAPAALVGSAWAISALVEVPMLIAFPFLARRFGLGWIIVLGAAALLARIIVVLAASDPYVAAASMFLHGAGFALLLVGSITYVGGLAPPGRAATAQGVFAAVAFGLANILGPATAGLIAGATTIWTMLVVAAVVCGIGTVALAVATSLKSGSSVEAIAQ